MTNIEISTEGMLGVTINSTKEWGRIMAAYQEMLSAILVLGGHAETEKQREALTKWIVAIVRLGEHSSPAMRLLYPNQTDAPWNDP